MSSAHSNVDLQALRDLAGQTARKGGALALEMQAAGLDETELKSSITDLVTKADREVENLIKDLIGAERPDDAVFGEEAGAVEGTSGLRWVIDPIDGTVNFYYRYPGWVISIAAESDAGLLAGAIYDPVNDHLYDAYSDGGARLNEKTLHEPPRPIPDTIDQCLVATGFGYKADRRRSQAEVMIQVLPEIRDIRRGGAAAMDLCHLSVGRVDAYFEKGLNAWDYAAGMLIARESDCVVEILEHTDGGDAFLLGARSQAIFDQLYELLYSSGAFTPMIS